MPLEDITNTAMRTEFNSVRAKVEHEFKQYTQNRFNSAQSGEVIKDSKTDLAGKSEGPDIHLTEDQVELLNWFNDNHPQICKISHYSKRSDKTNRNNANHLKELGLLELPEGKRYGLVITEAGRKYIDTHF